MSSSETSRVCSEEMKESWCLCFSAGDRRRCPAPAEERDDDEVPGTEARSCAQTVLPHRKAQTEPLVIRRRLVRTLGPHQQYILTLAFFSVSTVRGFYFLSVCAQFHQVLLFAKSR